MSSSSDGAGRVANSFTLGGISIRVDSSSTTAGLVDSRMRPLRTPAVESPDIVVDIRGPGSGPDWPPAPKGSGRPIHDTPGGPIDYFDDSDELFLESEGRVRLLCRPSLGTIDIAVIGFHPQYLALATYPLLTVGLHETMKRHGRFPLHAAGLALGKNGLLVPGSSGAGKSTLTVALVRAGFDFLSDDTVFVSNTDDGLWVAGFPDEIDVTDNTVSMFAELAHLSGGPLRPTGDKYGFRVDEVFGAEPAAGCRPVAIVAPRVEVGAAARLEPLSPSEALLDLMPNLLATDPVATQAHLDLLADLVRTTPCYSFCPGSDFDVAAGLIADLLT